MFIISRRKAGDGQYHKMYLMNRDGFSLLVMGFTGKEALEWKLEYIKAFNQKHGYEVPRKGLAWRGNGTDYGDMRRQRTATMRIDLNSEGCVL